MPSSIFRTSASLSTTAPEDLAPAELGLRRAAACFRQGRREDAANECDAVLRVDPANVDALYLRGAARQETDIHAAMADFDAVLRRDPHHTRAALARGACKNMLGDFAGAVADYEIALQQSVALKESRGDNTVTYVAESQAHCSGNGAAIKAYRPEANDCIATSRRPSAAGAAAVQHAAVHANMGQSVSVPAEPTIHAKQSSAGLAATLTQSKKLQHMSGQQDRQHGKARPAAASQADASAAPTQAKATKPPRGPKRSSFSIHVDAASTSRAGRSSDSSINVASVRPPQHGKAQRSSLIHELPGTSNTSQRTEPDGSYAVDELYSAAGRLMRQGQHVEAIEMYSRVISGDPQHFKARFHRAYLLDKVGEPSKALADYSAALALQPESSAAMYNRGITFDRIGEHERAIADFTAALRLDPENADLYHNRGFARRNMDDLEGALADYNEALTMQPDHARALLNRAHLLAHVGQEEAALQDYDRLLLLQQGNGPAYVARGTLHMQAGREREAIEDFTRSILLLQGPSQAPAFLARGQLLMQMGRAEAALEDLVTACDLQPDDPQCHMAVAQCLRAAEAWEEALEACDRVLQLDHEHHSALACRAYVHRKLGRIQAALQDYTEALQLTEARDTGMVAKLLNSRAYCWAALGNPEQAVQDYDMVLNLDADNEHALHNRGTTLLKMQQAQHALRDFDALLSKRPNDATLLFSRGNAYEQMGEMQLAEQDYAAAAQKQEAV